MVLFRIRAKKEPMSRDEKTAFIVTRLTQLSFFSFKPRFTEIIRNIKTMVNSIQINTMNYLLSRVMRYRGTRDVLHFISITEIINLN